MMIWCVVKKLKGVRKRSDDEKNVLLVKVLRWEIIKDTISEGFLSSAKRFASE